MLRIRIPVVWEKCFAKVTLLNHEKYDIYHIPAQNQIAKQ